MYMAGANCTVLGNYLTTAGRDSNEDLTMIADLGLRAASGGTLEHDQSETSATGAKA